MNKTMREQMSFSKQPKNSIRGWQESENQIIGISSDLLVLLKNCFVDKKFPAVEKAINKTTQDKKNLPWHSLLKRNIKKNKKLEISLYQKYKIILMQ